MVFCWSLNDSTSPQVSRTLLNILAVLNNVVVWWSPLVFISKSFSPCTNPLVTVPRAPITIGISHFHVPQFFQFPCKFQVLILLFGSFQLYSVVSWDSKVYSLATSLFLFFFFFFLLTITRSDRLAEIRWFCVSQYFRGDCASHSPRLILGGTSTPYLFDQISFFFFLHNSQWITWPT